MCDVIIVTAEQQLIIVQQQQTSTIHQEIYKCNISVAVARAALKCYVKIFKQPQRARKSFCKQEYESELSD